MEFWDALTSRRNVRQFTDDTISTDALHRILEAGRRSPSAHNRQPWDLVVVTERDRLQRLSGVWRGAGPVATSAATIAVVTATDQRDDPGVTFDLGQLTAHLQLAAADLGIASGHSSVEDQALARAVLGLPDDRCCAYLVPLGRPADRALAPIRRPDRRPLDEVVHWEQW